MDLQIIGYGIPARTRERMDLLLQEGGSKGYFEVEVVALTDVKIAVCAPGMGDEMQAIKAGILEVTDLLVVNKSDLPDADRTANHLKSMLHHRGHDERRSAHKVSTVTRAGLPQLVEAIDARLRERTDSRSTAIAAARHPRSTLADDVGNLADALVRDSTDPRIDAILADVEQGTIARQDGLMATLRILVECEGGPDFH